MPVYRTETLISPCASGLLPEGERNRRVALTSFNNREKRTKVPGRDVVCYECGRRSRVPAAALSANCIHCHAHLRMTDVDLKPNSRRLTVRTLGNVTVMHDAVLSQLSIVCHNLTLFGRGSGTFRCTGQLRICEDTVIEGDVQAGELLIDRGVKVTFNRGVKAEIAKIHGTVTGQVNATRSITLKRGSTLNGDCQTPMLIRKSGAVHNGYWEQSTPLMIEQVEPRA